MLLVDTAQMQAMDRRAIEGFGIPGLVLMENAGRGVYELIRQHFEARLSKGVAVVAGPGNNGGDGFVVARHLFQAGIGVRLVVLASEDHYGSDALTNYRIAKRLGIPFVTCLDEASLEEGRAWVREAGLVVDAIFGTGLTREIGGRFARIIEEINQSPAPVVAVDMPSGLSSDTGQSLGVAIRADLTVTMAAAKLGQVLYPGAELVGKLCVVEIGIPSQAMAEQGVLREYLDEPAFGALLRSRPATGHKGTFGHLLVLAGSRGKTGAAAMSAHGALRSGAGLVTLGCPSSAQPVLAQKLTEAMTAGLPETEDGSLSPEALSGIEELLAGMRALAMGPGLGLAAGTRRLVRELLVRVKVPAVVDADALNAIGTDHEPLVKSPAPRILTPHPGEMARLMGTDVPAVQKDRVGAASGLAAKTGAIVVLKGARTVVAAPDGRLAVNGSGNPGMGAGGMGDILTGIIGGLLVQGYEPWEAAKVGVYAHGRSADQLATARGAWGYLATEVADWLPRLWG